MKLHFVPKKVRFRHAGKIFFISLPNSSFPGNVFSLRIHESLPDAKSRLFPFNNLKPSFVFFA